MKGLWAAHASFFSPSRDHPGAFGKKEHGSLNIFLASAPPGCIFLLTPLFYHRSPLTSFAHRFSIPPHWTIFNKTPLRIFTASSQGLSGPTTTEVHFPKSELFCLKQCSKCSRNTFQGGPWNSKSNSYIEGSL